MANPAKIVIADRPYLILLTPAQASKLPSLRYADGAFDLYGPVPPGQNLYQLLPGDVISDPTLISLILGITVTSTAAFPNASLPYWQPITS